MGVLGFGGTVPLVNPRSPINKYFPPNKDWNRDPNVRAFRERGLINQGLPCSRTMLKLPRGP